MVISGQYGVQYVCHNITNRVLYSTKNRDTLIDVDILATGYEVVVKSVLGVYGQNKVEWERRKKNCTGSNNVYGSSVTPDKTQREEIYKIHLRASAGNMDKAEQLTNALHDIDNEFNIATSLILKVFEDDKITLEQFNLSMVKVCAKLFSQTISMVGRDMAIKIYPNCKIDLKIDDEFKLNQISIAS